MSFFEKCIKEIWRTKGNKCGKWFDARYLKYINCLLVEKNTYATKMECLKKLSKLLNVKPSFIRNLLKYEGVEEIEYYKRLDKRFRF